ncbi:MAG: hypothetical protein CVT92_01055 [Bacteroidetes bacterium HGW-Bacteroidetes-1]|jgi:hypothetical protein|nr:MAG: hypothetical protein CVT92_01055 [Bacteroidetes bacterium HGW-Bacteroidetes-1]
MNKVEEHRQKMLGLVAQWQNSKQSQKAFAEAQNIKLCFDIGFKNSMRLRNRTTTTQLFSLVLLQIGIMNSFVPIKNSSLKKT